MNAMKIENLVRDYGGGKGVFDVSFHVDQGEAFGFLGPNGAGKTTTIRHLMGFLKPKSGSCTINGLDCWRERDKVQARLGYIPGEISFFEDISGAEFLKFIAQYRGIGSQTRKEDLLERFELDPKSKIKKMSKGMKQKLGIVAAFMHDPDILILDEPTSGLDPLMQNRFIDLVAEEKKQGKTILMSSHMFEEVERTCDRIGIIRKGRMVAVDAAAALRERHTRSYTVTLENESAAEAFAADFNGVRDGLKVTVTTKQSLEEIFMNYYGGEKHDEHGAV
ncbi:ABC transporter ATP-binding protein [Schaedlerella arabinosiphila]|jgi:ABC-2 type transport system ATP-binding protein|uniref:ABC transporter ATP-binding protein n=1 Tax=Schaedlerella arabinosiphila TaxID=2044587 RepID=A0A9X5H9U4_9FIRM|nr:ABC transporter ATP-binding protein [Schaedlerella arabinosiphila]KAI4441643.1 Multidrug efflux system ATP-binding protein [Schaedlerella arabinosiphila]NDO71906.1 ABC transporter ATP-binding protein [Schaedlerella arabinosiphila]